MKSLGPISLAVLATATLASPATATAVGGVSYPGTNGGAAYGEPVVTPHKAPAKKRRSSFAARPVLAGFSVSPSVITPGQAPSVSFRVNGRAPTIRLRLVVSWPGTTNPERTLDLGRQPANSGRTLSLTQLADPALPEGAMSVRIAGRDSAGRILRPGAKLSRVTLVPVRGHVFPLRGVFSYGSEGAKFGAGRTGHTHQGQDLLAAEGIPVVAPRSGTIKYVQNQPRGAGWYVILDADGEDFDYAFMHLVEGSIPVHEGEHVDQGQRLGSVGHTGDAQGDHLHFEIWQGAWYDGGHPIDPRPYLEQWQAWSPVRAI